MEFIVFCASKIQICRQFLMMLGLFFKLDSKLGNSEIAFNNNKLKCEPSISELAKHTIYDRLQIKYTYMEENKYFSLKKNTTTDKSLFFKE
jgi:hypothetical protein